MISIISPLASHREPTLSLRDATLPIRTRARPRNPPFWGKQRGPSRPPLLKLPSRGHRSVAVTNLGRRRIERQHAVERLHGLAAGSEDLDSGVVAEPGTGRNEPAHDDILLETAQVIGLARDRRLGEDARGFLEGGR